MKKQTGQDERGFTLVELLIVTFMLGMVMTALYSVYTSHQRTAYTSDETVEVQQNLRIAIDSISRDIRTAGLLLQTGVTTSVTGTSAISAGTTASKIYISSGCPSGIITRLTPSPSPQIATVSPNQFPVDSDGTLNAFSSNDYVRIIHPIDKNQPGGTQRIYKVTGVNTISNVITLTTVSGPEPNLVNFNTGDVICKLTSSTTLAPPNTIQYYLGNGGTCPTGQQCLVKVDETGQNNVIAQNMANLQFQYLLDGYPLPNETSAPTTTTLTTIRAVRVTVTGQTAATVALSGNVPKTRQMETLIQIRNR
jgi:prepilin-type N-terminal cleavage/methylation domain-containing protein